MTHLKSAPARITTAPHEPVEVIGCPHVHPRTVISIGNQIVILNALMRKREGDLWFIFFEAMEL
jgi:hypothetical protein